MTVYDRSCQFQTVFQTVWNPTLPWELIHENAFEYVFCYLGGHFIQEEIS